MKNHGILQKIMALVLSAVMVLSWLPVLAVTAHAAAGTTSDGFAYEVADDQVTITEYTGKATDLVIPDTIEGYPVTAIKTWGISLCVTTLVIPDSVKIIGDQAFDNNRNLKSVTIGSGVETIGESAFAGTTALESFIVSADNPYFCTTEEGILFSSDMTVLVAAPGVYGGSYTVPEGVVEIAGGAFFGITELMDVVFPSTLETIGRAAFEFCGLTMVTIPESVTYIAPWAFADCDNLTEIFFAGFALPQIDAATDSYISTFRGVEANVYWRGYDASVVIEHSYGGRLTWGPMDAIGEFGCFCEAPEYEFVYSTEATCTEAAMNVYRCMVCEGRYEEIVGEPLGHSGQIVVTPPTETQQGYTTFTCSNCGETYVYDYTDPVVTEPVEEIPEGLIYDIIDGEVTITKYTGTATELKIPSTIEGYPVTVIGYNAFKDNTALTAIILPGNLRKIGEYAFSGCSGLKEISFPNGVKYIGAYAFYKCSGIATLVIPDSVKFISFFAFANCTSITSAVIGSGVEQIGEYAFYNCTGMVELVLKEGVKIIDYYAFAYCSGLTALTLPGSIEYVSSLAFLWCTGLEELTLSAGLGVIGNNAFQRCTALSSLTVGDGVQELCVHLFRYVDTLQTVTFQGSAPLIYSATFNGGSVTAYYPSGDETWTDAVKKNCSGWTWVEYGDNTVHNTQIYGSYNGLEYTIFDGEVTITKYTGSATQLVIPESIEGYPVRTISGGAVRDNRVLTSVTIPETVTWIAGYAFYNCSSLGSIDIPNSVQRISSFAFANCTAMTDVVVGSGVKQIDENAFYNCSGMVNLTLKYGVGNIESCAFEYCNALKYVEVPGSVSKIASYAFRNCTSLEEVVFGEGVGSIGEKVFRNDTKLKKVTFGGDIGIMGSQLFSNCPLMETLVFRGSVPGVCSSTTDGLTVTAYYLAGEESWTEATKARFGSKITWVAVEEMPACEHVLEQDKAVAATCTDNGLTEGSHCIRCGEAVVAQEVIPALGHDEVIEAAVAATCTETGLTEGRHCDRCGEILAVQEVIPALGHDEVIDAAVDATCTEAGLTEGSHCDRCGETLVAQEEVPALGHDEVIDAAVEPTCTETGLTEGSHCDRCGETLVAQEEVPALGHDEVIDPAVEGTCITVGLTEGNHCDRCGEILVAQEETAYGDHQYSEWVITTAPTFVASGIQEKTCGVCGDTVKEVLRPAVGMIEEWNITLTDALQVNFHLLISQTIESTATVKISVGEDTLTYRVKDLEKTKEGLYVASVKLAAAQMADDIVVFVIDKNIIGDYANYTVRQYVDAVLADESLSEYHILVKEMLNYGAAAQAYFDYCADNLADAGITDTGLTEIPETVDQEMSVSGSAEGVSFYAATLSYRDRVAVRFYFDFCGDIKACTFAVDGNVCAPGLKNGLYYVDVPGITPENLDKQIELTVTDGDGNVLTVSYSPMNYIVRMNEKGSESLKALLKALYNYHLAAKELLEKNA